jgi:hypothetical protein
MVQFERFKKKHGRPFDGEPVPAETFDLYAGKLPNELFEEWRQSGFCGYGDGLFWTVDPARYDDVLADWLEPAAAPSAHAFLRTALGGVFFWNGEDIQYLDPIECDVSMCVDRMDTFFDEQLCNSRYLENVVRVDLFKKALPKLGKLAKDECYGFLPPLAMGGPGTLETLKRVKLREHLALLAQVRPT